MLRGIVLFTCGVVLGLIGWSLTMGHINKARPAFDEDFELFI